MLRPRRAGGLRRLPVRRPVRLLVALVMVLAAAAARP